MRHRDRNRETEPELIHLFKNNLSDISREFLYTSHAGSFFMWGVSLTHLSWLLLFFFFLSREFLSHIPYWLHFYEGSFFYTSHAGFILMRGVSLTHPLLTSFLCREFLLHIPCLLDFSVRSFSTHLILASFFFFFLNLGSFSYTSRAGFIFMRGISLTHPILALFFIWRVSLTHPMLAFFSSSFCGEFLLHIPCCFFLLSLSLSLFNVGSFS